MSETKQDFLLRIMAKDAASPTLARLQARLRLLADPKSDPGKLWRKSFGDLASSASSLASQVGALGLAAATGLGLVVYRAIEAGSELAKMSQRLQVNATWYASMSKAAEVAEVSQEEFSTSLTKLAKNLGEARAGGGEALKTLQEISPVLAQQFKHAKSTSEAFNILTAAMGKVPDQERRLYLANKTMGKGSVNLAAFMGQGTTEVNRQAAAIFKLIGAQGAYATAADDVDDEVSKTKMVFDSLGATILTGLAPALKQLALDVREYFLSNRDGLKTWAQGAGKAISEWLASGGIQRLGEGLNKVAAAVGWVVDKLGPLGTAIALAAPLWVPLVSSVWGLAAALGGLVTAAGLPLAPVLALAAAGALLYANWDKLKDWPILAELDYMLGVLKKLTAAVWGLREATGAGGDPGAGGAPGAEETLTSEPLTRAQLEQRAQARALSNVGGVLRTGLAEGVAGSVPGLGLLRLGSQTAKVVGGMFGGSTGATSGARPREPANASMAPPAQAEVLVSFANPPRGARMEVAPGASATVDLSVGPTMASYSY